MRLLVVGAGATGGYFGGRLAQAGRDVTFLVRERRAAQLRAGGLVLLSPHGDVTLAPRLVVTGEAAGAPFDAVVLAVKAYALEPALADLAPHVGPASVIMPLLNGMRHVDTLVEQFGNGRVLGGVCVVATTVDGEGRIRQLNEMQQLSVGERDGTVTARAEALHAALSGAGFEARLSTTVVQDMWEKWVMLASLGALTCLLRGTVGEIEAVPGGADLARRVLGEASAVAAAAGHAPREAHAQRSVAMLTAKGSGFASSMYRDLQQGAPVEVDHILGDMVARGVAAGLDVPLLAAATAQLRVYQSQGSAR